MYIQRFESGHDSREVFELIQVKPMIVNNSSQRIARTSLFISSAGTGQN